MMMLTEYCCGDSIVVFLRYFLYENTKRKRFVSVWNAAGNETSVDSPQQYDQLNVDNGSHLPGDHLEGSSSFLVYNVNLKRQKHL